MWCNNKTIMVMKLRKKYSWVFRIYNAETGELNYRILHGLTIAGAEGLANDIVEGYSDIYVSIYRFYKDV